jgi:uncharacterized damage-inducible protein DinB
MNLADIRTLYDYNTWANQRTLEACAALTDDQANRDLGGSFKSVRETLVHILGAEWLWLERWHGRSHSGLPPASDYSTMEAVRTGWSRIQHDLLDFFAGITENDLNRSYQYKTTAGAEQTSAGWQMFQHVVNHGSYHRGQITNMLRQLGAKPQSTDLILFYRTRAAAPKA